MESQPFRFGYQRVIGLLLVKQGSNPDNLENERLQKPTETLPLIIIPHQPTAVHNTIYTCKLDSKVMLQYILIV